MISTQNTHVVNVQIVTKSFHLVMVFMKYHNGYTLTYLYAVHSMLVVSIKAIKESEKLRLYKHTTN